MKNWSGKLVGSLIGLIIFPPLGLFIGLLIGHFYDTHLAGREIGKNIFKTQQVFYDSTFLVMGHLAKSDGRVSENEIAAARRVMGFMGLTAARKKQAIKLFNKGKQPGYNIDPQLQKLKQACGQRPSLLRIFLDIQLQVAYADGVLPEAKRRVLERICSNLGVSISFQQFEDQFRAEQNYYQHTHNRYTKAPPSSLREAYRVLEIDQNASQAETKKAYRRLMSENHPDKLMAKGLPEDMIKVATEKTQQIKKAYDQICQAKGW